MRCRQSFDKTNQNNHVYKSNTTNYERIFDYIDCWANKYLVKWSVIFLDSVTLEFIYCVSIIFHTLYWIYWHNRDANMGSLIMNIKLKMCLLSVQWKCIVCESEPRHLEKHFDFLLSAEQSNSFENAFRKWYVRKMFHVW